MFKLQNVGTPLLLAILIQILLGGSCEDKLQSPRNNDESSKYPKQNFPPHIKINFTTYKNFNGAIKKDSWIAYPETPLQILDLTNWARENTFIIRPSGYRHSWAPLTIALEDYTPEKVIIVDTTKYLTKLEVISTTPGNSFFWAEPGIGVFEMLAKLEEHKLCLGSYPNLVGPSLGGILAIGGRGAGNFGANETTPPDHKFGSVSNLIVSLTAVVFDQKLDRYVLKEFHRSNSETKAFLVHLGRAFITNVTMRAGPLSVFHIHSRFDVTADTVFGAPANPLVENSYVGLLKQANRVAVVYFEFLNLVWAKTWHPEPTKPEIAVELTEPYFYPEVFADPHGNHSNISHFWGTSKNSMVIIGKDFPPISLPGWAVITNRNKIQKVIHEFHQIFKTTLAKHRAADPKAVFLVGEEIRTAELDHAADIGIPGAESPGLGTLQPIEGRPDLDVAIYLNILSIQIFSLPEGLAALKFAADVEKQLWQHFSTDWSVFRVEWSKNWAMMGEPSVFDMNVFHNLRKSGKFSLKAWDESVAILNKYDPFRIFSNRFLEELFDHQS